MRIDILYFKGCPNHAHAVAVVQDVLRELHVDAALNEIEVAGPEDAARLRFFGSPTIQVDGRDIDPSVRGSTAYSYSCRMYGRSGSPPRGLVEQALRERRPVE